MNKIKIFKILCVSCLLTWSLSSCSSELKVNEVILAKVKDKSISLNEFLRRAEYTIRPTYCRNNTNIDKQIILNSLIAEKLFSIEAEKNPELNNKLAPKVEAYLTGRTEQAMRQLIYAKEVTKKVKIKKKNIEKYLRYTNRSFNLSYISVTDQVVLSQLNEELNTLKLNFDDLLTENYELKQIPQKKVVFSKNENQILIDSLYTRDLKKGEVIGPIKIEADHHMFLKINSWTDSPVITKVQAEENYSKVRETLELRESRELYKNFIQEVMKNKRIEFNRNVFFAFTDIVAPIYLKTKKEKENLFVAGVWNEELEKDEFRQTSIKLKDIKDEVIFEVGNQLWTVDQLMKELKKHPLVFRKHNILDKEFGFELQMAIIDLVRDKTLTELAYKKGYDKNTIIERNKSMWADNLRAVAYKYDYLQKCGIDSLFHQNHTVVLDKYLNNYIDSLQNYYSDSIFVNIDVFNNINLSKTSMVANYSNAPFKTVVPSFPILTTSFSLDYGQKLEK